MNLKPCLILYNDFIQLRALWKQFEEAQHQRLYNNIADGMQGVPTEIIGRQAKLFDQIAPEYGDGVRKAVKAESQ